MRPMTLNHYGVNLADIVVYATKIAYILLVDDLGDHICKTQFSFYYSSDQKFVLLYCRGFSPA